MGVEQNYVITSISVLVTGNSSELVRAFISLYGAILMQFDGLQAMSKKPQLEVGELCIVTATQIQILEL